MLKEIIPQIILASPDANTYYTQFLSDHNLFVVGIVGAIGFFAVWWVFSRLYV